ncbi:hypothetical protein QNI19_33160 [Cytophagaceae bacterium DM2B3-1]|uniref:Uncharacterized protein n=1 Tax=Xanthocytophaga flava TaxID=3048013 RepID=A0ABT7CVR6_9BACT|nr:hypothetical protein [Xanthocytophaga flavus]MDJ1497837.1 hypothetical protein [Xanthocytophaga flavus]
MILLTFFVIVCCKKGDEPSIANPGSGSDSVIIHPTGVYVSGYEDKGSTAVVSYWKNGSITFVTK